MSLSRALVEIDASFAITVKLITWRTYALVTTWCVAAIETARRLSSNALIHINTRLFGSAWYETVITRASKASKSVDAFSTCTQIRSVKTIINILTVGSESHSMGTQIHELSCSWMRTCLAVWTPAFASVAAA
jgi:hypothetical protein